jgi:beta-carotene 3-hydroxylase
VEHQYIINIATVIISFACMEGIGWFLHKYVMHGPLWMIHKTHHQHRHGAFELNDLFSIFFGLIAIWLMVAGGKDFDYRFWIGTGISLFGLVYFIVHDILIHNRIKIPGLKNRAYFKRLSRAHKIHHKQIDKNKGKAFGLLWVKKEVFEK